MVLFRHFMLFLLLTGVSTVSGQDTARPAVPGLQLFLDAEPAVVKKAESQILGIFSSIETRIERIDNAHRKADLIFRLLRKATFRQYRYIADMSELVHDGVFNCVSSTALLAMAYTHFGIEYEIREQPNHVYLYARTGKHWARAETTVEDFGLVREKKKPLRESADWLQADPVSRRSSDKAAMERKIDLAQLAGLQHYNRGLKHMDAAQPAQALAAFQIAEKLYPCKRVAQMTATAAQQLKAQGKALLLDGQIDAAYPLISAAAEVLQSDDELRKCLLAVVLHIAGNQPDLQSAGRILQDNAEAHPMLLTEADFRDSLASVQAP